MQAATVGLNYTLNQYIKVMGEYKYSRLSNVYYPMDKNFHELQMRLMVSVLVLPDSNDKNQRDTVRKQYLDKYTF